MGITVVAAMLSIATPASAQAGRLFNAGPQMNGYCLATHEPHVFAYSKCRTEKYVDQSWDVVQWSNGYRIQSLYLQGCLTARGDGSVFTYTWCENYTDARWRPYQGQWGMWENVYYAGYCLAAHPNGRVFVSQCNKDYSDQYWFINS
ncbi:hypothetical protein [Kibdelosporangium philippinense]